MKLEHIYEFIEDMNQISGTLKKKISETKANIDKFKNSGFIYPKFLDKNYKSEEQIKGMITSAENAIQKLKVFEVDFSFIERKVSKLIVPDYQREFKWTNSIVESFIKSLSDSEENLGNIIIRTEKEFAKFNDSWYLVDGQQRVTTLYAIKIVASYLFLKKKLEGNDIEIIVNEFLSSELKFDLQSERKDNCFINELKKIKIELSKNIEKIDFAKLESNYFKKNKTLKFMLEEIKINEIEIALKTISNSSFTTHFVFDGKQAYKKFYKTNSIIMPLEKWEIFRTLCFENEIISQADPIYKDFEKTFCENNMLVYFVWYISGQKMTPGAAFDFLDKKIFKNEVKEIKNYLTSFINGIKDVEMKDFSFHTNTEIRLYLIYIKHNGINRDILYMIYILYLNKQSFNTKNINDLIRIIFSNWVNYKYFIEGEITIPRFQANRVDNILKKVEKSSKISSDKHIKEFIKEFNQYPNQNSLKKYVDFQFENEDYLLNKKILLICENEDNKLNEFDCEHFISQSEFKKSTNLAKEYKKINKSNNSKDSIGNLFYISKKLNAEVNSKDISEKLIDYFNNMNEFRSLESLSFMSEIFSNKNNNSKIAGMIEDRKNNFKREILKILKIK